MYTFNKLVELHCLIVFCDCFSYLLFLEIHSRLECHPYREGLFHPANLGHLALRRMDAPLFHPFHPACLFYCSKRLENGCLEFRGVKNLLTR